MTSHPTLQLMGAPGSPYTRKMLALMRFRNIPYNIRWQALTRSDASPHHKDYPQPKVPLLPTFYLPDSDGKLQAVTDSSPLLRRLEKDYNGRHVIPSNPVLAFLNWLVEDYADEWLTKSMFHYRWHYADDVKKAGDILPRWSHISDRDETIAPLSKMIRERQIARLSYVGSNETTKPTIEASFQRFLNLFNAHLQHTPFMFGTRPASADFAIYGQCTQLALFDPTPQKLVLTHAPRLYAWTEIMEDLSGYDLGEDDWLNLSTTDLPPTLHALLKEIGTLYLPYLIANAKAVAEGAELMETELDGRAWTQAPFAYQAKCLAWIKEQYHALSAAHKTRLATLLDGTNIINQLS